MTESNDTALPLEDRLAKLMRHIAATPDLGNNVSGIRPQSQISGGGLSVQVREGIPQLAAWAASLKNVMWTVLQAGIEGDPTWWVTVAGSVEDMPIDAWDCVPLSTGTDAESVGRVCAAYTADLMAAAHSSASESVAVEDVVPA